MTEDSSNTPNGENSESEKGLGHQHGSDPKLFVHHENLGVKTTTRRGKTLKLDRDVFEEAKLREKYGDDETEGNLLGSFLKFLLELAIILVIVVFIRTFIATPFQVDGASMKDTLLDGEKIFVNKTSVFLENISRGDIIVFEPPYPRLTPKRGPFCALKQLVSSETNLGELCGLEPQHYVKRVIGVSGDMIKVQDGKVYMADSSGEFQELDEPYLNGENRGMTCFDKRTCSSPRDVEGETFVVPEDKFLVMGDNRQHSTDSREAFSQNSPFNQGYPEPYISYEDVIGSVRLVIWPPSKWQWLSTGE